MKCLIPSLVLFSINILSAQPTDWIVLVFEPTFQDSTLIIEDTFYKISEEDSVQIENLQFYISQIEFYNEKELVFAEHKSFHLIDVSLPQTLWYNIALTERFDFTHVAFNLGIDSLTNAAGAMGGDLDPTKGMYWTWQSGYINFKLEGTASNCPSRKNRFQFHIGGYQPPFYALQKIIRPVLDKEEIKIKVAIDEFLLNLNLEETYEVMSPNQKSVELAKRLPKIFSVIE